MDVQIIYQGTTISMLQNEVTKQNLIAGFRLQHEPNVLSSIQQGIRHVRYFNQDGVCEYLLPGVVWTLELSNTLVGIPQNLPDIIHSSGTTYENSHTGNTYLLVPGTQILKRVNRATKMMAWAHCDGATMVADRRLDVQIFINGVGYGLGGASPGGNGTALSWTPTLVPMIAMASTTLQPQANDHLIDVRFKTGCGTGEVRVYAVSLIVMFF